MTPDRFYQIVDGACAKLGCEREEALARIMCALNGVVPVDADGSPNWWIFSEDAKKMLQEFS